MPNQMDVYRIVADPGLSPDQKRSALDMLYDAPAPAAAPDMRRAEVDPRSIMAGSGSLDAPPPPAPMMSDATQAPPPPVVPVPAAAPLPPPVVGMSAPPPESPQNMSPIPPVSIPPEQSGPAAPPAEAPAPTGPTEDQVFSEVLGQTGRAALRGSPVRVIPGHIQPHSVTVQHTAPLPDEMKDRIETANQAEQGLTLKAGDTKAENAKAAVAQAEDELFNQKLDQDMFRQEQIKQDKEIRAKEDEYNKLVDDTKADRGDWWASKTTGQKVLTAISALLFGLAQNPNGIKDAIDADMAVRAGNRKEKLGAARMKLDTLKSRILSPEAAHQLELGMSNRVAATELRRLAATAETQEVRDRAELAATQLEAAAATQAADAWSRERGTMQEVSQYVPERSVGGGMDPLTLAKKAKEAGLDPEQYLRAVMGGQYNSGKKLGKDAREQAESEVGRTVAFPDGTKLYARNPGEAIARQKAVDSASEILNAYNQIEAKLGESGHSISRTDLAEINAIIAQNMVNLKNSNELGQITKSDEAIIAPLSGSAVGDTVSMDAATRAGIEKARQLLLFKVNTGKRSLFQEPWSNAKTGGTVAADVEVPSHG